MFPSALVFFVNGRKVVEREADPECTLLVYLRRKLRLCGTKLGCGEGACGACTVMISYHDNEDRKIKHISANACLMPLCSLHGCAVTTVEGIGSTKTKLHTIQERIAKMHASQCGFCTPGIVMSMYTLLRNKPNPTMETMEDYLQGNLCRCTGYRPIIESMKTFCADGDESDVAMENGDSQCTNGYNGRENEVPIPKSKEKSSVENALLKKSDFENKRAEQNGAFDGINGCSKDATLKQFDDISDTIGIEQQVVDLVAEAQKASTSDSFIGQDGGNLSLNREMDGCCGGDKRLCCMAKKCSEEKIEEKCSEVSDNVNQKFLPYDESQEPIFPPELLLNKDKKQESLVFKGKRVTWYRPTALDEILELKTRHPDAKMVIGNTEVGLETKFKDKLYPVLIQASHVKELKEIVVESNGLRVGASATLNDIEEVCKKLLHTLPEHQLGVISAFVEMMKWFASKQIRYVASIGGNIMTGSPISDLNPIFMAASCRLDVASVNSRRSIVLDDGFYTGYRKTRLKPEEVLVSIKIPYTHQHEFFRAFKQAKRRDDDIAIVNAAFRMELQGKLIKDVNICYGGLAPVTKMARKTMASLRGKSLDEETMRDTLGVICEEFDLPPNAPGGMVRYRRTLALGLFFKFFVYVADRMGMSLGGIVKSSLGVGDGFHKGAFKSHQFYKLLNDDGSKRDVGQPIPHKSSELHATGEAVYVDDMARTVDELDLVFVTSKKAHAKIVTVDASRALQIEGVVDFVSSKDLTRERNLIGLPAAIQDEEVFASEKVHCVGQIIGAVIAENREIAKRAASEVDVVYEELPTILTIEQAIEAKSFFDGFNVLQNGNVEQGFASCDHVIEGQMTTGAQEHFYMETQTCRVIPLNENDEFLIFSSTQDPTCVQEMVAKTLGIDCNRVACVAKRLGGGFGGKETRSCYLANAVAVAANKVGKPIRMTLDRDEDMAMTGDRHPFLSKYKVAFNKDGRIIALNVDFYSNAGWSQDLSLSVMHSCLVQSGHSYFVPNLRFSGQCCRTNLPSNTAFRGFGSKQANMMFETWIDEVGSFLQRDPTEIRAMHLCRGGEKMHHNQLMEPGVKRCFDQCIEKSQYEERKREVAAFNKVNRWKKRGISVIPVTYGIGLPVACMSKGAALIHVYNDGSVLLNHGGVEMGQGLHTKMIQVASSFFGIPHTKVFTSNVATDKVPNNFATAASLSSDLYGMAVIDACTKIMRRMEPFKKEGTRWEDWVREANFNRVSLSATGYHSTPGAGYDIKTNSGQMFSYFTFGAGCSVVEIDCLTGDHKILRTDIVMDVGESLNPAIDIGQIEGAFMQGYGMFVMEQLLHTPKGELITRGPSTYKIPGFGDVPQEFNVILLSGSPNLRAVHSSRAIGEPPLFLGASVYFAIKNAIGNARADAGFHGSFSLASPATAERIRMACEDVMTTMVPRSEEGTFTPWSIQV